MPTVKGIDTGTIILVGNTIKLTGARAKNRAKLPKAWYPDARMATKERVRKYVTKFLCIRAQVALLTTSSL